MQKKKEHEVSTARKNGFTVNVLPVTKGIPTRQSSDEGMRKIQLGEQ